MEGLDRKELQAQWKTEVEVPTYGVLDVAKHNTKDDLWIIIHGKGRSETKAFEFAPTLTTTVYDVTSYGRDHPGGIDALIEVAGQDATGAYEDVGHSEDAREIMHPYLVGTVEGAESSMNTSKPKLRIVRRSESKIDKTHSTQALQSEFLISCGGAILLLATIWLVYSSLSEHSTHQSHGRFATGFLSAAAVSAGVGYLAYNRFSQALNFGGDYTRFPAHMHSSDAFHVISQPSGVLKPQEYQEFPLIRKDKLSSDSYRFVFQLPTSTAVLGLPIGQHVAIKGFYDNQEEHHTVTRSYTPVSNNNDLGRLELVIKEYSDGLLTGKCLSKLELGGKIAFRGPKGAMKYRKGMSKRIGMIAGGTGITPMYQLIRAICENDTDDTTVSLIYANKSPEDILLRRQLENFQKLAPKKLQITLVVDKATSGWTGETGRINKAMIKNYLPSADKDTKILLCGPQGMINASKNILVELGFEAPGAVSRMTDQIFLF